MSFNMTNSTNNTTNFTPRPRFNLPMPPITTIDYVLTVLLCVVSVCIITGNLLVLLSFRVNRRLRTKTNYFILSLAFADLLIGILSVPYYVYFKLARKNPAKEEFYKVWLTMDVVIGVSSIMNLTMISLERAYALLRPIEHRNVSKALIIFLAIVAWMLGILAGTIRNFLDLKTRQKIYGLLVFSVFFAVPLAIILVTYAIIFKIASAHARGRGVRSFKKDLRIATTIAVVIGFFTINWLPFFSLNLFFSICRSYGVKVCFSVPTDFLSVTKLMQYGNSFCNPIIYGFRNKDFKITFKKIIYKLACKDVAISSYTHSTYNTRHTRRVVRGESSFDDSMVYPDQMVPAGMYDTRDSYRNAITNGPSKKTAKTNNNNNTKKKSLAQGLMALNIETFSMPERNDSSNVASHSELTSMNDVTTPDSQSEEVKRKTAESRKDLDAIAPESKDEAQSSSDIEVYPVVNTSPSTPLHNVNVPQVSFDKTNGFVNGGLCNDDNETINNGKSITETDNNDRSHLVPSGETAKHTVTKSEKNVSFT